ncbi:hypothetical protein KVV02_006132 [Mortierella alpina]|uniref:Uncharacterized protein n=1 Tax=Mortierella alpina TaxID=64518 RepID=A0A9P8AC27_MORAP|nr:hypothetical protein KVV02_006132 [Mortierella alpina]
MKFTATALLAACVPSLAFALVGNDWKFDNAPADGLNDITFPFNMAKAPRKSGYYFAQQFNFHNVKDVGYTGLQPREDSGRNMIIHAAFSSFQAGTTTTHKNCHYGADGGPGVSCAVDIIGNYLDKYSVSVQNVGGTTWRGTLVNDRTRRATVVGQWTLPAGAGKIVNGQVGFVEYYNWNDGKPHACNTLPFTEATFYNPTSRTRGARGGKVTKVYEYGNCVGKVRYATKKLSQAYNIKVGF